MKKIKHDDMEEMMVLYKGNQSQRPLGAGDVAQWYGAHPAQKEKKRKEEKRRDSLLCGKKATMHRSKSTFWELGM